MHTITDHTANEWSRFAQAAYAAGHNPIGHRYSVASATLRGHVITSDLYDALQNSYRDWMCFNTYSLPRV